MLLSTNIVESGLDIPTANTMIVHRADMFGLAQLYQLRGRIGRGKLRGLRLSDAAAPDKLLTATAQTTAGGDADAGQLGAGFQLASHDMDIRGAGNLLGEEQSGHIREVGIELYQQMLEDAVAAAQSGGGGKRGRAERMAPQINRHLGADPRRPMSPTSMCASASTAASRSCARRARSTLSPPN